MELSTKKILIGWITVALITAAVIAASIFYYAQPVESDHDSCNGACVQIAPQLASVDSEQGILLNAIMGGFLDSNVNLSAVNWQNIAQSEVNLADFLLEAQSQLTLSSPEEALTTNMSMIQFLEIAADVVEADGDTASANALNLLKPQIPGASEPIQLQNLLNNEFPEGSFSDIDINTLDFLTGAVQLYNYENVVTTPNPISLSGSSVGLSGIAEDLDLYVQVIEPPVIECGFHESTFHSAAIRLKLDLNLVDVDLGLDTLGNTLEGLLGALIDVEINANLANLDLYVDIARAQGSIGLVDAIATTVNLNVTPGVTDLYLGHINDSTFFNRTHTLNQASDLQFGTIGSFGIKVSTTLPPATLVDTTVGIQVKSFAEGQAVSSSNLNFSGPYPETKVVGSSSAFAESLITELISNLEVKLDGDLGALLDPLVNDTILPGVKSVTANVLSSILSDTLTTFIDPLLEALGIGLGEAYVTVLGVTDACSDGQTINSDKPKANNDTANAPENLDIQINVLSNDTGNLDPSTVDIGSEPNHGEVGVNPNTGVVTYDPDSGFVGTDSFTYTVEDKEGNTSNSATVSINVIEEGMPIANNDMANIKSGESISINVLSNDIDTDGQLVPSTVKMMSTPTHGSTSINASNGHVTYTPAANFTGTDTFTYQVEDNDGNMSNTGTISVMVSSTNPPTTGDGTGSGGSGGGGGGGGTNTAYNLIPEAGANCLQRDLDRDLVFRDLDKSHWGFPFIDFLRTTEIIDTNEYVMSGYKHTQTGNTVEVWPNSNIYRYEMVKIALISNCISIKENISGGTRGEFSDLSRELTNDPFMNEIKRIMYTAFDYGLIDGNSHDRSAKALEFVTRSEAAKIILNATGSNSSNYTEPTTFEDVPKDAWFYNFVSFGQEKEIFDGYNNDQKFFGPVNFLLRSEASKMVSKAMTLSLRVDSSIKTQAAGL